MIKLTRKIRSTDHSVISPNGERMAIHYTLLMVLYVQRETLNLVLRNWIVDG